MKKKIIKETRLAYPSLQKLIKALQEYEDYNEVVLYTTKLDTATSFIRIV